MNRRGILKSVLGSIVLLFIPRKSEAKPKEKKPLPDPVKLSTLKPGQTGWTVVPRFMGSDVCLTRFDCTGWNGARSQPTFKTTRWVGDNSESIDFGTFLMAFTDHDVYLNKDDAVRAYDEMINELLWRMYKLDPPK